MCCQVEHLTLTFQDDKIYYDFPPDNVRGDLYEVMFEDLGLITDYKNKLIDADASDFFSIHLLKLI